MSEYVDYGPGVTASTRDRTHTLFGQTMGLVAVTTGFFALGAYLGRNMTGGLAILWWIVIWSSWPAGPGLTRCARWRSI